MEASNIPDNEKINYKAAEPEVTGMTSITIQEKRIQQASYFPIYPNRRTILTIGDGSKITVSFWR